MKKFVFLPFDVKEKEMRNKTKYSTLRAIIKILRLIIQDAINVTFCVNLNDWSSKCEIRVQIIYLDDLFISATDYDPQLQ